MFHYMTSWLLLLAFFSVANPHQASSPSDAHLSFQQVAHQADQARISDHLNDAIALYSEAIRLRPSWSKGSWWLGSLLYDQDRFAEAATAFRRFVATGPKPAPGYAFLGLCEYETREYDQALQHFQNWGRHGSPGTDELLDVAGFHWALLLTRRGEFTESLYLLAAKAQKRGESPALIEAMGLASLRIANLPEDYPAEKRESVWLAGKAAFHAATQDYHRAHEYGGRLLAHYGNQTNVHYFRGTLFGFEKERDAAREEYQKELQLSPDHAAAMVELALTDIDESQMTQALPLAERAVALEPRNARARYALGRALVELGRTKESVGELEIARELAPDSPPIRFALGRAYAAVGRDTESKREFAAFRSLKENEGVSGAPKEQAPAKPDRQGPSE